MLTESQKKYMTHNINPLFQCDFYKIGHAQMYADGCASIYSNLTPRKSRIPGVQSAVFFGLQYFIKEYLINQWNLNFFQVPWEIVGTEYQRVTQNTIGKIPIENIKKLHDLGYLPIKIKALPEGDVVPVRVPCITITNTIDHAYWLVNYLETSISNIIWQPSSSATIAQLYRQILNNYAMETVGDASFVQWQGHDFSYRGMSSLESACTSGAGHLLSFTGTDTIPAILFLEKYYNTDVTKELVGASVPATEHSVMALGMKDSEEKTFLDLLNKFPEGILSVVSDTWSLPNVLNNILPNLKDKIMARNGKLVIRPDSFWTDPVDCMCGFDGYHPQMEKLTPAEKEIVRKGVVESLWDIFGGTISPKGYKMLDSHIGAIYGDSITVDRAREICERLKKKGFASTNVVLGIGSFTYQYNTRDTLGFAMKATHGVVNGESREIFKDPVTDDGMKKSAKGLIQVKKVNGEYTYKDCVTPAEEEDSELTTVFLNGKLIVEHKLSDIRNRVLFQ